MKEVITANGPKGGPNELLNGPKGLKGVKKVDSTSPFGSGYLPVLGWRHTIVG